MCLIMLDTKEKAFTLVELIVVVTILAILATIGFVSYSSYLTWVRDTNRIAQMTSLSDWLNLYSTANDLPIPEANVEVSVNGELIAYQWYSGANILETINFTKWGLDPKDNTYFSYYLTRDRRYFQLMWFLEESADLTTKSPSLRLREGLGVSSVNAVNFQDRIPTVSGDKLWILTDINNNPAQDGGTDIDVWTTTESYKAFFKWWEVLEWDSSVLSQLENVAKIGGRGYSVIGTTLSYSDPDKNIPRGGLLLELLFNWDTKDNIWLNNDGLVTWTIEYVDWIDKIWNEKWQAISFNWSDSLLTYVTSSALENQWNSFAWSFWFQTWGDQPRTWARLLTFADTISSLWNNSSHQFRNWVNVDWTRSDELQVAWLHDLEWHHVVYQWDGSKIELYVDNILIGSSSLSGLLQSYTTASFTVWGGAWSEFLGFMDNVRVYDDILSESDIQLLYEEKQF